MNEKMKKKCATCFYGRYIGRTNNWNCIEGDGVLKPVPSPDHVCDLWRSHK